VRTAVGGDARGTRVAVWGLSSSRARTTYARQPALTRIDALIADGASVAAHDSEAMDAVRALYGGRVTLVKNAYDPCKEADALVLVTEQREYQNPNFKRIKELLGRPVDGRNIWSSYGLTTQGSSTAA
jgi:UDPglucose 6-dehydrogenase